MTDRRQFLPINIAVLTVSDTRKIEDDRSGDILERRIIEAGHNLYKKRNPKGHSSKQITTSSDFMPGRYNRAEEDLKRFKKIVEKN